jgi:hypothetical protein
MKCHRAALFVALVTSSSSFTHTANGAPLTLPLAATAQLCEVDSQTCHAESLPAGSDLRAFVERRAAEGKFYRLSLQLPAGEFELHETWRIGADLPAQISHLSIAGSPPITRLSGARTLSSLGARIRESRGVTHIELPPSWRKPLNPNDSYTAADPGWPSLRDDRGSLRLARWPREGWAEFSRGESAPPNSIHAGTDAPLDSWRDERNAWILGFFRFGWHAAYAPLTGMDDARNLTMGGLIRYGVGDAGRYRVLNLRSSLVGEYWFESGNFHVRPHDGAAASSIRIAVLATPMMSLSNVRSVDVTGIEFADTRGDGITIENSTDVNLSRLRFEAMGRAGVVVDGGRNVHIRNSTFEDLGTEAVILHGGNRPTLESSGHVLENCHIERPSQRLLTPATAVRLEGVGHVVRGNVIEDAPHSAVYFDGNDRLIESNWFERICLEVDDAGAIYAGRDWTARGTVIRNNVFANIHASQKNGIAVAVYLDDMLSGIRVENNAMVDVDYGVLVGGGRDNVVERNLFQRTKMSVHVDERARTWAQKAVAPGEVMEQRLKAVPTRSPRWQAAYPDLAAMPRDAAIPAGNRVRDNLAAATGEPNFVASAVESGTVQPPSAIEIPAGITTADALLTYCSRSFACQPFDARIAARSVSGAAR